MSEIPEQPNIKLAESMEYPARVLLIDDYESITRALKRFFKDDGDFETATCHDVDEALAAVKRMKPQIILLDHSLTRDADAGFKIARQVWQMDPNTQIISTTSRWLDVYEQYQKLANEMKATHPVTHVEKHDHRQISAIINS